ncbi:MAG: hypothetical protein AAGB00_05215 [Planctomycetota bacterium]
MLSRRTFVLTAATLFVGLLAGPATHAAGPDPATYERLVGGATQFLAGAQAEDGSFSGQFGSGVTSLVATALMRHGRTPADPVVAKALDYVQGKVQPDGGVYQPGTRYRNYETCLAILCFSEAKQRLANDDKGDNGRYDLLLAGADRFIRDLQWDEGEGHGPESMNHGGGGYGKHGRPDGSNTGFLVEALKAGGADEDDPAVKAALLFVSRMQNLETEYNTSPFAAKVGDGGFYYTPAAGGQSQAGTTANGGLKSYGSMTYVGLKSMIYAGVGPDDPRVKAAYAWVSRNYTLDTNPGMGSAGYYYYLHTFAKALDALGKKTVTDAAGVEHDWRRELVEQLAKQQKADGSWINDNERWLESDPKLVAGYCLLALAYCTPEAP